LERRKRKRKTKKKREKRARLLKDTKMLLLQCPKCGNRMKYQSKGALLAGKKKACVYCGKSFDVSTHIIRKIKGQN
jgi:hypothetical protein